MHRTSIDNLTHPLEKRLHVEICDTYLNRLRGYMFHEPIQIDQGLLFIETMESRVGTAIHMFFVNFDLGIIWIDKNQCGCRYLYR